MTDCPSSIEPLRFRLGPLPRHGPVPRGWQAMPLSGLPGQRLVEAPVFDAGQWAELCQGLRRHGRDALQAIPLRDIMAAIDRTAHILLDRSSVEHQQLLDWLPHTTGFGREMIRCLLPDLLKGFRAPQLQRFVSQDLPNPLMLDGFEPNATGGWTHARGPDLLVHVWAGNVPGLPLWSLVCGLMAKAGNLGKVSAGEPVLASVFARTLLQLAPALAPALAIVWWSAQDPECARTVWAQADTVMAYGGQTALDALHRDMPAHVRFLGHGPRLSVGAIGRCALSAWHASDIARLAAQDMARHEQQGCYSPQVWYVERGGKVGALEWAERLHQALLQLNHRWPRPSPDLGQAHQIGQWRDRLSWEALLDPGTQVLGHPDHPACVVYHEQARPLAPGPLHRSAQVVAVDRLEQLPHWLSAQRPYLQTVGIAVSPARLQPLSRLLAHAGITRLCAVGRMSLPPPGWHNDGRPSLLDLLTLVDLDASAEQLSERLSDHDA